MDSQKKKYHRREEGERREQAVPKRHFSFPRRHLGETWRDRGKRGRQKGPQKWRYYDTPMIETVSRVEEGQRDILEVRKRDL